MSISEVNNGGSAIQNLFHQRRADFKSIESAVQSGNITAAQADAASLTKDLQNSASNGQAIVSPGQVAGAGGHHHHHHHDASQVAATTGAGQTASFGRTAHDNDGDDSTGGGSGNSSAAGPFTTPTGLVANIVNQYTLTLFDATPG